MPSTSRGKEIETKIREMRSKGINDLDIYLALRTIYPNIEPDFMNPHDAEILNRMLHLKAMINDITNTLGRLEKRVMQRHDILVKVNDEINMRVVTRQANSLKIVDSQ